MSSLSSFLISPSENKEGVSTPNLQQCESVIHLPLLILDCLQCVKMLLSMLIISSLNK